MFITVVNNTQVLRKCRLNSDNDNRADSLKLHEFPVCIVGGVMRTVFTQHYLLWTMRSDWKILCEMSQGFRKALEHGPHDV